MYEPNKEWAVFISGEFTNLVWGYVKALQNSCKQCSAFQIIRVYVLSSVLCRDSGWAVCGQRSGLPLVQLGGETVGRPDELAALHHVLVLWPDGSRVPGRPHHRRRSAGTGQVDVGAGLLYWGWDNTARPVGSTMMLFTHTRTALLFIEYLAVIGYSIQKSQIPVNFRIE